MLSVCVSETVPLGVCHSASVLLTGLRVYASWTVHARRAPPGQIGVLCAHICIIIVCRFWSGLPPFYFSIALLVNKDTVLGLTVEFVLYVDLRTQCGLCIHELKETFKMGLGVCLRVLH